MTKTILISAGGTGGHVFPALTVAKLLETSCKVIWVGGVNGIENKIIPANNIQLETINISGLRRQGIIKFCFMPFILMRAFFQALIIILRTRPSVIVGFGGYPTFPICLMGFVCRIPVLIHEQNSIAGLTNKILSKIASVTLVAFAGVLRGKNTQFVGNPVREEISNLPLPELRYAKHLGGLNILVLGGSLGAQVFNDMLPEVFARLDNIATVVHQVGRGEVELVANKYAKTMVKATAINFIDNMAEAYKVADLIICRSGALTVSEIAACGIAAIFIPYPFAVDDHQRYNALPLVKVGAAKMIVQSELTVDKLAKILAELDREQCKMMAIHGKSLGISGSSRQICDIITRYI